MTDLEKGIDAYNNKKYEIAFDLLLPLAKQKDIEAQYYLGRMYHNGWGVVKNFVEAFFYYTQVAKQRHAQRHAKAQYYLAIMYCNGNDGQDQHHTLNIPKDFFLAYKWFSIAKLNHHLDANGARNSIRTFLTSKQIEEAKKQAKECVAKDYKDCG